jgi:hypothetical protein
MIAAKSKRFVLIATLIGALLAGSVTPSFAFLDKTRFVFHLGIAYFSFHHWVLKPYQQGAFSSGAPHRISTIVKGGAALLFAVHEVKVADRIAKKSSDPLLQKLDSGVSALESQFGSIGTKLKSGQFDPKDIAALTASTTALSGSAAAGNLIIKDVHPPSLASGSDTPPTPAPPSDPATP